MEIAIPIYDRFTALDAVGPYEVLSRLPDARVRFIAPERGPYKTDNGMLTIVAEARLEDLAHPEVIVVPGGTGTRPLMKDERMLDWIRTAHETSTYTTSVCTGSLLLGAAGVLDGLEATTHWLELEALDELGARSTSKRVVEQGKVITAAGVSAGIDMALVLAGRIAGDQFAEGIQLLIEYDPQPPFDAGSKEKAPPETVQLIETLARQHLAQRAGEPSPA
jgi:transcriptional regulator GlxA family with amidase domain